MKLGMVVRVSVAIVVFVWLAILVGCATKPAPRVAVPPSHPVKAYEPTRAWKSTDVDLAFRGVYEGEGCPDAALWLWNLDEPAERAPLADCEREVTGEHPFHRGRPFRVWLFYLIGAARVGWDSFTGRP